MREAQYARDTSIARLVLIPAVITLAVNILRLVGERLHWSEAWFSTAPGGPGPLGALMYLLAPIFGVYFALNLARSGRGPSNVPQAAGLAVLGLALLAVGFGVSFLLPFQFPGRMLLGYVVVAFAAVLQVPAWPRLAKTLLAYAYAARIPVVIVMYLALQGQWHTHFDNVPPMYAHSSFGMMFTYFALLPQLIFLPAYTVISGSLFGTIAAAFVDQGPPSAP